MDVILEYFSVEELCLLGGVLLFFLLELYYWVAVFGRVALRKIATGTPVANCRPVSVVLSARNEYEMLQQNLPLILTQDYPDFEVIVVNDCSADESEILLASMQTEYPNLQIRTIVEDSVFKHSKKMALGIGIKAARHDLLLFIDADCFPSGQQWLQSMQQHFTEKKEVVIGYTKLTNTASWIRADHFMQSLHYLGKALRGRAYMASNSNLAYRRETFFNNKGFDLRVTESLREDVVLVNKIATRTNTAVAIGPESTTTSTLPYTSDKWRRRRVDELRSLALTGRRPHYPASSEALIRILFFAGIAVSAVVFFNNYIVLAAVAGVFLLRIVGLFMLWRRSQKRLGEKGLLAMLWLWDFVFPFYYLQLIFAANLKQNKTWR